MYYDVDNMDLNQLLQTACDITFSMKGRSKKPWHKLTHSQKVRSIFENRVQYYHRRGNGRKWAQWKNYYFSFYWFEGDAVDDDHKQIREFLMRYGTVKEKTHTWTDKKQYVLDYNEVMKNLAIEIIQGRQELPEGLI